MYDYIFLAKVEGPDDELEEVRLAMLQHRTRVLDLQGRWGHSEGPLAWGHCGRATAFLSGQVKCWMRMGRYVDRGDVALDPIDTSLLRANGMALELDCLMSLLQKPLWTLIHLAVPASHMFV